MAQYQGHLSPKISRAYSRILHDPDINLRHLFVHFRITALGARPSPQELLHRNMA